MTDQHRFRQWARDEQDRPATRLIPAATVIVARDGPDGIETLMLRRDSKLAFAGGMWVFPGGRLDDADHSTGETGGTDDSGGTGETGDTELDPYRRAAVREAMEEAGITLAPDGLVPYSHWEPPAITPRRFSTWFFLTEAPEGGRLDVVIDDGEIRDHAWLRPADALARREILEVELSPPTWVTLFELAAHDDVATAVAWTQGRTPEHFATKVAPVEGGVVALWHGDAAYGEDPATPGEDPHRPGPRHRLVMLDAGWHYERRPEP